LGWRSIFLINLPLGALAFLLAWHSLPADAERSNGDRARFDTIGTLLLALTLAAYALAMTIGRGSFGGANVALLLASACGIALFALAEAKSAAPLIRVTLFRDAELSAGFATSAVVATVVMATLVVGPFYLSGALGLDAARTGLVMTAGPLVAALMGVPSGRLVDRFGAYRMTMAGLAAMAAAAAIFSSLRASLGIGGYVAPLVVLTAGYALFQTANNTAVMSRLPASERGTVSGMLSLARNLGLITGASVMGAVFALAAGAAASSAAVTSGLRATFAVATALGIAAMLIARASRASERASRSA
ncbi:MAG TPA: MFS transporter, partial [Thermoanaerobaculia bacterium]|nr:MFS transporter [Thermoanaerobaculia bacterium]